MMMVVVMITATKCMSPHEPIIKSENWASQLELLSPCKSPPRKMMMMMMTQFSTANFPILVCNSTISTNNRILSRKFVCRRHPPPLCSWTIEELQIARRPDSDHCRLQSPSPPRTRHSTKP
ncbi:hypothetical protein BDL97_09G016600 [Sphagnum fallax]|nr:hypothetical protein BDL97_09G016600 [Sphagnum fallax]